MKKIFILFAIVFTVVLGKSLKVNASESENDVYEQDFSDPISVREDFTAYYVYTLGGSSEDDMIYSSCDDAARWYLEDNSIIRKSVNGDIDLSLGTNSIGVLTYTKKKFVNFELTVDYCAGTTTYYWPVVAFRQREAGKYYLSDGAGVFVQRGGKVTLWGTDGVGGPYETAGISGYVDDAWHTLKIRVEGIELSVYVDGSETPQYTKSLPNTFFRSGYISLVSVNNDCKFRNFKVEELPVKALDAGYKQEASLDTTSPDSLDVLAGAELEELEELDYVTPVITEVEDPKKGCAGSIISAGFSLITLCAVAFVIKHKKK
jgi:hypothetical protein